MRKAITIKVMIENDQLFEETFQTNQKIQVILNKLKAKFKIELNNRTLRREDSSVIKNYDQTIEEVELYDLETLNFYKNSNKPDRDERFA